MINSPKTIPVAFVVLNPVAGIANAQLLKRLIDARFHALGWKAIFHLTEPDENTSEIVKQKVADGDVDIIVAVGGDGTIAAIAAGMVHSSTPLGIIPTGTWNAIARNLQIPFNPVRAINLMTGKHNIRKLDLMGVSNTYHAMNVGVGFSATMINNTPRGSKRKVGLVAYLTNFFKQIFGLQLRRYAIEADGMRYRGRATEIMVANYGVIGWNMIESALNIKPDDGKVDVLIFRARTLVDLPVMFWQALVQGKKRAPKYRQISVSKSLVIRTNPPGKVQADGELIGETPVKVTVFPRSVKVIVP